MLGSWASQTSLGKEMRREKQTGRNREEHKEREREEGMTEKEDGSVGRGERWENITAGSFAILVLKVVIK